jgi:hypothetical protein
MTRDERDDEQDMHDIIVALALTGAAIPIAGMLDRPEGGRAVAAVGNGVHAANMLADAVIAKRRERLGRPQA